MKYADLHIHSSYSDGCLCPEEIVKMAKERGVKCISITDHDTIASQYIVKERKSELIVIPGIEFSTEYNDLEIHILGYRIDIENPKLSEAIYKLRDARIERAKDIINILKDKDIFIDIDDLIKDGDFSLGRGNIAKEMVKKGYVSNFKEAFTKYLMQGKIAYVQGKKQSYKEIIKLIEECGGIAVLAHPGKIYRSIEVEKIIKELKCYGLKGLEVYHPSHSKEQINYFYNLSKKYKLLITGGSDFHGVKNGDCSLGSQGISELLLDKIINIKQK
ncbi:MULTISPECIES: PHP domain-containing protein [Clostridium]|uniref:PHP domain-containing protein n=1 Tax=Clostridium cibarium TaxID=2762247 RepID=A0ABR8PP87_9CLOT|nr:MULTISPECIES: PHP domain-containing protein [Clostridium]MBD7909879.1 PHP domain-containing protein [Clostridium cibarium]